MDEKYEKIKRKSLAEMEKDLCAQTRLVDIPYIDSCTRSVLILHDMENLGDILKKTRNEFYRVVRPRFSTEVEEFLMARGFKWGMPIEEFERINKTNPDGTNDISQEIANRKKLVRSAHLEERKRTSLAHMNDPIGPSTMVINIPYLSYSIRMFLVQCDIVSLKSLVSWEKEEIQKLRVKSNSVIHYPSGFVEHIEEFLTEFGYKLGMTFKEFMEKHEDTGD